MACEIVSTPGAVFCLWGTPTVADMDRVQDAITKAATDCGHPVIYVTRVPVDAPPPDAKTRARLDKMMPVILPALSTYHVVMEGEGFSAAVKRGVMTGIFQLSWRRKTFFVHATTIEVSNNLGPQERAVVHTLLEAARLRGFLTGSLRSSAA